MTPAQLATVILLLPLASAAVIALFLRRRGALASRLSVAAAAGVVAVSLPLIFGGQRDFPASIEWLRLGDFAVSFGVKFDDLAALMLFVVSVVGFLIHVFSLGYMRDDAGKARYFAGLSVFMFSMLGIVLADNLFMIFVFWELVGFSSYLLIGHWHEKTSAADAAKKAFIVNRVGDFGFLLGIVMCYWTFGTVNLGELANKVAGGAAVSAAIPLLLFCGAVGKSAQMPLHVWLPDAMEGPTPVSALIHAATMVAAGVYMLCRINMLMVPEALGAIACVGAITALYAALCAVVQTDIKRVLAYSTLSQLGYMIAAFGLGSLGVPGRALIANASGIGMHSEAAAFIIEEAGVGAAMFHLTTHAFFKALLFLAAGSVITACHHEQDIFKLGGLRKKMPVTFWTFTIGVAAISGVPFLAGFFSKDAILYLALEKNTGIFAVLVFTAVLTVFYMVRMWKIAFFGKARSEHARHAHESSLVMILPLVLLALLSVVGGYAGFYRSLAGRLAGWVPLVHGPAELAILIISIGVLLVGATTAWFFYAPADTDALKAKSPLAFGGLTQLKESFDDVYGYYVAKVQQRLAILMNFLDRVVLAGLIRVGAGVVGFFGLGARALHVGTLHAYVYWFLIGVALLWGFAAGVF